MLEKISLKILADRAVGKKAMTIMSACSSVWMVNWLTLEWSFSLLPLEYLAGSSNDIIEIHNQDFLRDMLVGVVGVFGKSGDELVTGFECDRSDLAIRLVSDIVEKVLTFRIPSGTVAVKSRVWRSTTSRLGKVPRIFINSFLNPWSSSLSASSRTRVAERLACSSHRV
jgi:hypothetical protein